MNIKFVSYIYSPGYLCNGILKLIIDGKTIAFDGYDLRPGQFYEDEDGIIYYRRFWYSGGECYCGDDCSYSTNGPWEYEESDLPKWLKPYADELIKVMNDNVEYGCCGGCI